jgi:diguanylate cyclase (GGDEF)-like protein
LYYYLVTDANRLYEGLDTNECRDLYANSLNKALEIFVSYTEKEVNDIMSKGLKPIAAAAGLDRINVYRILNNEVMLSGERYRWDRLKGGTAPIDDDLKEIPISPASKRWISIMSDDSCISLKRSEFKEDEAALLTSRGVMSFLLVPVFTEGEFWGVVTFSDITEERDFDNDCIAMLRSTARMCVSTIIRAEKTKSVSQAEEVLKRREKMLDMLNKVSLILLSENEGKSEDTLAAGVHLIADMAEIDRIILYRNHIESDGIHILQVYRWGRNLGSNTDLLELLFADTPSLKIMPNWKNLLEEGNSLNGPSKLMSNPEAGMLKSFGILSAAAIPIHINNSFWGFALFADTKNERSFEDDIIEMLRSAAFLFANAFIRSEIEYDVLTGIYNRRFFDKNIKRIIKSLSRSGGLLSVLIIDIDFFKQYNDTYGHVEGDNCLKIAAQTLYNSVTRADDFVARYGGEEFIVVLPFTDRQGAEHIAEKLLDNIRNCNIPHKKNEAADCLTISIGVTTGRVLSTHTAETFVKKADEMLYKAKQNGRNKYFFEQL